MARSHAARQLGFLLIEVQTVVKTNDSRRLSVAFPPLMGKVHASNLAKLLDRNNKPGCLGQSWINPAANCGAFALSAKLPQPNGVRDGVTCVFVRVRHPIYRDQVGMLVAEARRNMQTIVLADLKAKTGFVNKILWPVATVRAFVQIQ